MRPVVIGKNVFRDLRFNDDMRSKFARPLAKYVHALHMDILIEGMSTPIVFAHARHQSRQYIFIRDAVFSAIVSAKLAEICDLHFLSPFLTNGDLGGNEGPFDDGPPSIRASQLVYFVWVTYPRFYDLNYCGNMEILYDWALQCQSKISIATITNSIGRQLLIEYCLATCALIKSQNSIFDECRYVWLSLLLKWWSLAERYVQFGLWQTDSCTPPIDSLATRLFCAD